MKNNLLKIGLFLVIVGITILALSYFWYNSNLSAKSEEFQSINFSIAQNEDIRLVTDRLEAEGIIKNAFVLQVFLKLNSSLASKIQAGEFVLSPSYDISQIVNILQKSKSSEEVVVTIREGLRYNQIADYLIEAFAGNENSVFNKEEFLNIATNPDSYEFSSEISEFLSQAKPKNVSLEGFLYPETYFFASDYTAMDVIERLVLEFINKLADNYVPSANNLSFYENLVLSSIVESEGINDSDREIIASVFLNRLKNSIALQSDATVNYATGKSERRPSFNDLLIDSPYNTYKYPGLPPTPINSPRIQALNSVLNPITTEYFYFIHEEDGTPHYGKTLNKNILC